MQITGPTERLNDLIQGKAYEGLELNREILDELGFFVVRNILGSDETNHYYELFKELIANGTIKRSEFHSTEYKIDHVSGFDDLPKKPSFKKLWPNFFSGKVGSNFKRILSKDQDSPAAVILHQDTSYQFGDTEQYSLFTSLTPSSLRNGGLQLYPGTHKLGYLGDAGSLNPSVLPKEIQSCAPNMARGDVLIMHSATWHFSEVFQEGEERVYLEWHILSAESPFSNETLWGDPVQQWQVNFNIVNREESDFFVRSRSMRLKNAIAELEELKKKV